MQLTPKDIEKVATLARLALTEQEKKHYADQLSVVFEYMETLNGVDTSGVPETVQVTGLEDVTRADEVASSDSAVRERLIRAFPERDGDLLKVQAVFDS